MAKRKPGHLNRELPSNTLQTAERKVFLLAEMIKLISKVLPGINYYIILDSGYSIRSFEFTGKKLFFKQSFKRDEECK